MNKELFRKESLESFSSPEQLNDYIRVSNPTVWVAIIAILLLLTGVTSWGVFGRLDTRLDTAAESAGGSLICYISESDIESVKTGMSVIINETEYTVKSIPDTPEIISADTKQYINHIGGFESGEWVYAAYLGDTALKDGIYKAAVVIDRVAPISFVTN